MPDHKPRGAGDILAVAFGTTTAMWVMGYVGRMPGMVWPGWLVAAAMGLCLLIGGYRAGRWTGRGWRGGLYAGLATAVLNLIFIGALVSDEQGNAAPSALGWLPGTLAAIAAVMTLAAAVGARASKPDADLHEPLNWTGRFARTAVAATGLLLLAGGLVTGREAGLAVPDWPQSYTYNMFLFPLAKMTGNVFYEHSHRLVGAYVGLATVVLAVHIWIVDRRRWLRVFMLVAVLAVCIQGLMGGLRVVLAAGEASGVGVEVAGEHHETAGSLALRVTHGVFAQVFLAMMVAAAVFTSRGWRQMGGDCMPRIISPARKLSVALVCILLVQLCLGALVRHLDQLVMVHLAGAAVVFFIATGAGMKTLADFSATCPGMKKLGTSLLGVVMLQIMLGFGALMMRGPAGATAAPTPGDVIATTLHQLAGAALLALATMMMLYTWRAEYATGPALPLHEPGRDPRGGHDALMAEAS